VTAPRLGLLLLLGLASRVLGIAPWSLL